MKWNARHPLVFVLAVVLGLAFGTQVLAQSDPLPSWNEGAAKEAIVKFVEVTTTQGSPQFVPPAERIATFDQDGTLWVEHPMYSQVVYCFDRVPAVVKARPELANVEPFKTVMSGNREAIAKLSMDDLFKILAATLTGMSVEDFKAEAKKWLDTARDPRWKRPYTELTYLPMQEVLKYLRANGYRTYIVTGGGQDFVRMYADEVYGIPPEHVIGSHAELRYETFVCSDDSMRGIRSLAVRDQFFAKSARTTLASGAAGASALRAPQRYSTTPDPITFADAGTVTQVSMTTVTAVAGAIVQTWTHAAEQPLAADAQLARLGVAA